MGGPELASVLLGHNQALKVIFMSGDASVDLRQREQLSERAVLLKKPLDLDALLTCIEAAQGTAQGDAGPA
jgi:FixJ family two-component response regulator